jgi:ATP-dependent helicase/nuclease subunit B
MFPYFSASRLKTLSECKKRFYHQYIVKDLPEETSPFAQMGDAIHKVLEVWRKNPEMSRKQLVGMYAGLFKPDKEWDWLRRQGFHLIWKLDQKRIFLGELVGCEIEFETEINGINFKGIIDKVEKVDDIYIVTDYKTNKSIEPELYYHQLGVYDIAMEHMYPSTNRRYELFYLRHNKVVPLTFNDGFHEKMHEKIASTYTTIMENAGDVSFWPQLEKRAPACSYCPLSKACW